MISLPYRRDELFSRGRLRRVFSFRKIFHKREKLFTYLLVNGKEKKIQYCFVTFWKRAKHIAILYIEIKNQIGISKMCEVLGVNSTQETLITPIYVIFGGAVCVVFLRKGYR